MVQDFVQTLRSRWLTLAIVTCIFAVNAIALLNARQHDPQAVRAAVRSGDIPRLPEPTPRLAPAAGSAGVILPEKAPEIRMAAVPLPRQSTLDDAGPGRFDAATLVPRDAPTIFPQPVKGPIDITPAGGREQPEAVASREEPAAAPAPRNVAMASPYAPGVRVSTASKPRQQPGDERQDPAGSVTSGLQAAVPIARSAAARFDELRLNMSRAQHEPTRPPGSATVVRPVAPQLPRIVNAEGRPTRLPPVRPRLVRRPARGVASAQLPEIDLSSRPAAVATTRITTGAIGQAAPDRSTLSDRFRFAGPGTVAAPAAALTQPVSGVGAQVAALPPAAEDESATARRDDQRAAQRVTRRTAEAARQRRATRWERRVQRLGRRQHADRSRRRSERRIDGFRPSFHRQLVNSGFFGVR